MNNIKLIGDEIIGRHVLPLALGSDPLAGHEPPMPPWGLSRLKRPTDAQAQEHFARVGARLNQSKRNLKAHVRGVEIDRATGLYILFCKCGAKILADYWRSRVTCQDCKDLHRQEQRRLAKRRARARRKAARSRAA